MTSEPPAEIYITGGPLSSSVLFVMRAKVFAEGSQAKRAESLLCWKVHWSMKVAT